MLCRSRWTASQAWVVGFRGRVGCLGVRGFWWPEPVLATALVLRHHVVPISPSPEVSNPEAQPPCSRTNRKHQVPDAINATLATRPESKPRPCWPWTVGSPADAMQPNHPASSSSSSSYPVLLRRDAHGWHHSGPSCALAATTGRS